MLEILFILFLLLFKTFILIKPAQKGSPNILKTVEEKSFFLRATQPETLAEDIIMNIIKTFLPGELKQKGRFRLRKKKRFLPPKIDGKNRISHDIIKSKLLSSYKIILFILKDEKRTLTRNRNEYIMVKRTPTNIKK